MLPLLFPAVFAAEPPDPELLPVVLVSSFQPDTPAQLGFAGVLESLVADALSGDPDLRAIRIEDTPPFEEYDARIYLDGCPPGDIVGCSFVIAERGGAAWAVAGKVAEADAGRVVEVSILDVVDARVVVSFQVTLEEGNDAAFAEGVRKVLGAAMRGEVGRVQDIRHREVDPEPEVSNEELARQLAELAGELGDLGRVVSEQPDTIQRPVYTVQAVAERMQGEGMKPWDRLGMAPGEWLRFKNSGMALEDWRLRARGRQYQVLIRPALGWWRGGFDQFFYGRYAYDNTLTVVDRYSAQGVSGSSGVAPSLEVGFGLMPIVDVAAGGGIVPGHISVDVSSTESLAQPVEYGSTTGWVGGRATVAPFPARRARPTAGFGVTVVFPPAASSLVAIPPDVDALPSSALVYFEGSLGAEVSLHRYADLYLRVPVDVLVGGDPITESRTTAVPSLDPQPPNPGGETMAGALVGIQVRLLGKRSQATLLDDIEEEP